MIEMKDLKDRATWLGQRYKRLGGSDASAIVGMNPYMDNVELWEIKTGRKKKEDISDKPYVQYGLKAEKYLRELFALDYPQYEVGYVENNLWLNDKYPFAHASLDGWLTDQEGRKGVLEIKTVNMNHPSQKAKWDNRIPDNYYCQVCWYMAVYEADFAVLKAHMRWEREGSMLFVTRHYFMERSDMQEDIDFLMQRGAEFFEYIKEDKMPPLLLPSI